MADRDPSMAEHIPGDDGSTEGARGAQGRTGERRASHRVQDDQKTGQGSLSALSKLKMMERKRAANNPAREGY